jgi:hypothetical protein
MVRPAGDYLGGNRAVSEDLLGRAGWRQNRGPEG